MTTETTRIDAMVAEGLERYPHAEPAEIERIAAEAQRLAKQEEREGNEAGISYAACQSSYGCDWEWGDGTRTVDASGREVIDPDEAPTARVYDCDGETLHQVS